MKQLFLFLTLSFLLLPSCDDEVSYAELRANERKQIAAFLNKGCLVLDEEGTDTLLYVAPIRTISEAELKIKIAKSLERGEVFHQDKNEYTYLEDLEVYMHIESLGTGDVRRTTSENGITTTFLRGDTLQVGAPPRNIEVRYVEYNIAADTIQTSNMLSPDADILSVSNDRGTINGQFVSGVMNNFYKSTQVPQSWLYPLYYVRLGCYAFEDSELAKVRLIVPSTVGQSDAYSMTYPCFYELTYLSK